MAWVGFGVATAAVVSELPWTWGYYSYYNPYAGQPIVVENTTIDYSQPVVTARSPAAQTDQAGLTDEAMQVFDTARTSFRQGDYQAALKQVDRALATLPNDVVLHQFRSLVLFAMNRYQDSAAAIYAVLSVGPGWDWTTLSSLYADIDVYAQQGEGPDALSQGLGRPLLPLQLPCQLVHLADDAFFQLRLEWPRERG